MTNSNPIKPSFVLTENFLRENLDVVQSEFSGSGNANQAQLDEQRLCRLFIRQLCIPGGVRKPQDCAKAMAEKCRFIAL